MRLVLDSSAAIRASSSSAAAELLTEHELLGPPLLWSEVHSAAREAVWRRELTRADGDEVVRRFAALGVARRTPAALYSTAVTIAEELGWAKTYDAEFLALARLERAVVLTTDGRLRRGADRTGLVIDPSEL